MLNARRNRFKTQEYLECFPAPAAAPSEIRTSRPVTPENMTLIFARSPKLVLTQNCALHTEIISTAKLITSLPIPY